MVFSSVLFLFLFLNIVLIANYLLRKTELRNIFLVVASLFFYAWGEHVLVFIMIGSIAFNYLMGILIDSSSKKKGTNFARLILALSVSVNLLVLIYYKYFHFILENLGVFNVDLNIQSSEITLPIGISFFTFQNISYLIDIYRKQVEPQRNIIYLGLYISLFPQLIAGPIVRYIDIAKEIKHRIIEKENVVSGIKKFIRGLAKKVIIANNLGIIVDLTFAQNPQDIGGLLSWLAIICYTLQIYFDFSGYSDMAIGIGRILGFSFKENFNYPYISKSIQEFWRRWHISLSTWFRDYLYIPLGGNRKGKFRTYLNLLIVFFITGLWHGANWNFIVWGMFHGAFLLIEKNVSFNLPKPFKFLSNIYVLLVVIVSWVLFRAKSLSYAVDYLQSMFSFSSGSYRYPYTLVSPYFILVLALGLMFSSPIRKFLSGTLVKYVKHNSFYQLLSLSTYIVLFYFTILELSQATYNPFIYYRF